MIHILNKPYEGELEHPFKHKLDDFQKHAFNIMNTTCPHNILCCAQTGSGKSLLAEYAILKAIEKGKKAIYCSPIKTLSNQKFYEMTKKYKDITFGIITGDNKHRPDADVLIMTTEILMIMLSKNEIKIENISYNIDIHNEVDSIIFDEVHYINDRERGNVWEKSIMTIPKNISIVMLSATINKPENFLTWIHTVNGNPSYLLSNEKRVVPLRFSYGIFMTKIPKELKKYEYLINKMTYLMSTENKTINNDTLNNYMYLSQYFRDNRTNFRWLINETCKYLDQHKMCPAIFFVFSKKTCFFLAESISEHFNDDNESREVERDIAYYLSKLEHKDDYMKTPQYFQMIKLAKKGIAVHHAGLIPVFKEIIEMLFSKNLIKILFATETFAVGLNMPTKTVLMTDVFKFDNSGKRMLYSHEFIQMSGRAGRRGLDTEGHVILLPQIISDVIERVEFKDLMMGNPQTIESKFYIDENLILSSIRNNNYDDINNFIKKTLLSAEMDKQKKYIESKITETETKLGGYKIKNMEIFEEKEKVIEELNAEIQPSNNQRKRLEKKLKDIENTAEYKGEYSVYNSFKDVGKNLKKLQNERDSLESFITTDLNEKMDYLTKNGFFENNEITLKGKTALLFRELDNVIGAELVFSVFVDTLDERKYLSLLTLITEGRNSETFEIPESQIEIYHFVDEMFPEIIPNREYVFPVLDWYDGSHISNIINNYKIFEGDLIKTINKINNYIDELNEGYILKNNLKFVEMLNSIKNRLQREIVSTESLYLRL